MMRIISGGQTGVDRAALDAAIHHGIDHGGYCPKGRIAEDGRIPDKYNLIELLTSSYPARTRMNVKESDGTLLVLPIKTPVTRGTLLTKSLVERLDKPNYGVFLSGFERDDFIMDGVYLKQWLKLHNVKTLNVAGPRESSSPGVYEEALHALKIVFGVLVEDLVP